MPVLASCDSHAACSSEASDWGRSAELEAAPEAPAAVGPGEEAEDWPARSLAPPALERVRSWDEGLGAPPEGEERWKGGGSKGRGKKRGGHACVKVSYASPRAERISPSFFSRGGGKVRGKRHNAGKLASREPRRWTRQPPVGQPRGVPERREALEGSQERVGCTPPTR